MKLSPLLRFHGEHSLCSAWIVLLTAGIPFAEVKCVCSLQARTDSCLPRRCRSPHGFCLQDDAAMSKRNIKDRHFYEGLDQATAQNKGEGLDPFPDSWSFLPRQVSYWMFLFPKNEQKQVWAGKKVPWIRGPWGQNDQMSISAKMVSRMISW